MSDEQPPLSFRLKPRTTPSPASESVPPPPKPPAVAAGPLSEDPLGDLAHLRLKPKTPMPEVASPDTSSGLTFATPQPFPPAPPPPVGQVSSLTSVPPPPVVPPGVSPPSSPLVPPIRPPHLSAPRALAEPVAKPSAPTVQHTYKADKWLAGIVVFVLVVTGAFYGIRALVKAHPKSKNTARAVAPSGESAPAPAASKSSPRVEPPTTSMGKAFAKARAVVAARDKREAEEGVESVLNETSAAPQAVPLVTTQIAAINPAAVPVLLPAPVEEPPPPPPSDAFRQFVVNLRVNGVFQGEPARAMLNKKMYRTGEIVDEKLRITFYKVDGETRDLIFRDDTGAIMPRHY